MLKAKRILIAAGGTGGHINPALSVAGYIRSQDPTAEILFVGTADKMEAKLVPQAGYPIKMIDISGFRRDLSPAGIHDGTDDPVVCAQAQRHGLQGADPPQGQLRPPGKALGCRHTDTDARKGTGAIGHADGSQIGNLLSALHQQVLRHDHNGLAVG